MEWYDPPLMAEAIERHGTVDGLDTRWLEAPVEGSHAPVLYVHGVPTAGWEWREFLARTGGCAPDLPGFGASDKPAGFDYSIEGYADWLEAFVSARRLERFSLVVHDWGAVGLALAQRMPERVERLVVMCAVPFLPGYRWHFVARRWRTRLVGELSMGFTTKIALRYVLNKSNRDPVPHEFVDSTWEHFDHGTQRAILKLYRSAPPEVLARAGARLGAIEAPALVTWGGADPYLSSEFAQRYADALGGETTVEVIDGAGHWPWLDEPTLIDRVAAFVTGM
jgi:pimeloyl-ACP methyl ester carboxylesterase